MTLNNTNSCEYHDRCPSYEYTKCISVYMMSSCRRLNEYLINKAEIELINKQMEEQQHDSSNDVGLLRVLKK